MRTSTIVQIIICIGSFLLPFGALGYNFRVLNDAPKSQKASKAPSNKKNDPADPKKGTKPEKVGKTSKTTQPSSAPSISPSGSMMPSTVPSFVPSLTPSRMPSMMPSTVPIFVQKGNDIDGEDFGDNSGISVSVSSDGETVAIGATGNNGSNGVASGHVRVFRYVNGMWEQKGSDIDGEAASDNSGTSVSLSSDGDTVAVGSEKNDGINGIDSGHVRVLQYVNGAWVQKGLDIDGEAASDYFGVSVSLSSDGDTVAIGATKNNILSGYVRVFKYVNGMWEQKGSDIDGEESCDESGTSVSLSSDGDTVAIGATLNSNDNGMYSGHVRVFKYVNGMWEQKGSDIDGEAPDDNSGTSVSLSSDGDTVAVGAAFNTGINGSSSGHVRVFRYVNGMWDQKGSDIDGEAAGDLFGASVSLSSDGNIVAIGAYLHDGTNTLNSGHVRVFKYVNDIWVQIGFDIDGVGFGSDHFGRAVSLSSNGRTVAIGAHGHDYTKGHVRVFELAS